MVVRISGRFKIFYGWWIVGAFLVISFYVSGVAQYGFTALFTPIQDEFGWSYAQISLAASIRGMEAGILAPVIGLLVDRSGPKRLMLAGLFCFGAGLIILGYTNSLGMFYGAFVLIAMGNSTCVGVLPVTTLSNWFRKKLSLATGIMACGAGFSGLMVPVMVQLMYSLDWRMTIILLGALGLVVLLPISLLVRKNPEGYGLLPDGAKQYPKYSAVSPGIEPTNEQDITGKQALKSTAFWLLTVVIMFNVAILIAVMTHVMPYLNSIGIERRISGLVASAIPLASVAGRLASGWLGDRFNKRLLMCGNCALLSLSLLVFAYVSSDAVWTIVPFVILFGTGYGGNFVVHPALTRDYFGRRWFGTINGLMMGIAVVGSVAGPLLAGWTFDSRGSYYPVWLALACLAISAGIVLAVIPRAEKT